MWMIFSAVQCVVLLIIIGTVVKSVKEYIRRWRLLNKLPTAQGKQFLIGHAGKFAGLLPETRWLLGRLLIRTSKPVFTLYLGPGVVTVAITGPEELEVIMGSMKHLHKSKAYDFLHRWLEDGLLTSTGAKWQKRRKILTPAYHFSILLQFLEIFNRETGSFVKTIETKYLNRPVDIVPLVSDFTLLTINETSMGTKLDPDTKEGAIYKNAIFQMGNIVLQRSINPWLWIQAIFDLSTLRKVEFGALNILHSFTDKIIRSRSKNFTIYQPEKTFQEKRKHQPLMDILLNAKFRDNSIDEKGIREEVNTFMFEGHDTTATCLNFTVMLLACHKDIQDEVYQEIVNLMGLDLSVEPTFHHLQQMDLLERCIKESLRLYPPVPVIGRKLSEDVPTKYGTIPKGVQTFIPLYDLHRNLKYWPNPNKFDPSRYLLKNSHGRHPFAYIPFSAGPRNCIGQRFAMLEMKAFLVGVLRKFVLEPVDTPDSIMLFQNLVLRPRDGITVKFSLRQI